MVRYVVSFDKDKRNKNYGGEIYFVTQAFVASVF
jgi:hypothetical protein